jgi:hypothetical protein
MLAPWAFAYLGLELAPLEQHKRVKAHKEFCISYKEYFGEKQRMLFQ